MVGSRNKRLGNSGADLEGFVTGKKSIQKKIVRDR